jgi:hypothetical protein
VALANKLARIAWAVLAGEHRYGARADALTSTADTQGRRRTEHLLSAGTIAAMDERSNRCPGSLVQKMAAPPGRGYYGDRDALIPIVAWSQRLLTQAGYIYGRPRRCKSDLHVSATRLLAVIYPVSNDPDGFRGTTPNH